MTNRRLFEIACWTVLALAAQAGILLGLVMTVAALNQLPVRAAL